jgi:hypothetical protein
MPFKSLPPKRESKKSMKKNKKKRSKRREDTVSSPSEIFFYIALFCSIYRSRIRLQAISELGHPSICRMRQALFLSGGCDTLISRRGHACGLLPGMHSYPAGAISAQAKIFEFSIKKTTYSNELLEKTTFKIKCQKRPLVRGGM